MRIRLNNYEANPRTQEHARRHAVVQTRQFLQRLPTGMMLDRPAFEGEALATVAMAGRTYQPPPRIWLEIRGGVVHLKRGRRWAKFTTFCHAKVQYALIEELRRQDPVPRTRRQKLKRGEAEEGSQDEHPLSLDYLHPGFSEKVLEWIVDPARSPEDQALREDLAARLRAAILSLEARDQFILALRYWREEPRRAVAEQLGISETRVVKLERDALLALRRILGADYDEWRREP